MPSTWHCMARLLNRWELLSVLLDNPVATVTVYGCGTANHSLRTPVGNILLHLRLFCLVGLHRQALHLHSAKYSSYGVIDLRIKPSSKYRVGTYI